MALTREQSVSILYDLAISMAGETRAHPLATVFLQRLMHHTGSSSGAVLLNPVPSQQGNSLSAEILAAIGNPALREMEGKIVQWPAWLLTGEDGEIGDDWFADGPRFRHALKFDLPGLGCILLFFAMAPVQASKYRPLFGPILGKFARSLRHCLDSENIEKSLQQSEARFRNLVESSPDWIWEVNAQGIYTFSNSKVFDLLGYAPEEVLGRTPFDFMPAQEAKHTKRAFRDIAGSRRAFTGLENINLHKQGHEVVLETSGVPELDSEGKLLGYRGIDRDITQRKRIEEELLKARQEAEASNHAKSLFLSSMSHELRTPMNAILGHAQLISMQNGLPESVAASAREISEAGNTLLALMNDVLELAGIETGGLQMQIASVDLGEVLDACLGLNANAAELHKTPLDCSTTCDRCCVAADRHCLLQVLNQLVSNAIKYNRTGERVSIRCQARSDGRVQVSVTDSGHGIAAADQARLFIPFNRLGAERGRIQGAGVGLAIARRLIEAMSGMIGVDSTPGKGCTFWVDLPAADCEEASPEHQPAQAPASAPACPQGARVLVAEDYAPNQNILKMQLAALGCQADIADNGAAALKKWLGGQHDLILADLNMPELDGLALAREVREHENGSGRHTPIICITAADQPEETRQCLEAGMDDVLTKPIELEALKAKLARWLGQAGQRDQPAPAPAGEAVLDLDSLYRVLGEANPEQGRALLATFIDSAKSGLARLTSNAPSEEWVREMHKQKSSARTVGALRYAGLADALEKSAKTGTLHEHGAALSALKGALSDVEAAFARLSQGGETALEQAQPLSGLGTLLVVDDDPVVLQQMAAMLSSLGAGEVLTASNGQDALALLSAKNGELEALICDLSMPAMDGVEVIRLFGRTGYQGKLILMSGADEKVLSTAGKLAELQGLLVLGQVQKPVTPAQIVGLLSRRSNPRIRKRQSTVLAEVSPQSIRDAIDKDEFRIWFQPKVNARSLKPVGVEALARWRHPSRGILIPDTFIGVAEREGLVGELSQILTSKALIEGARLHAAGYPLSIAVNLSGLWLDDLLLPDFILATALAARLRPEDVILEVTETGVMKDLTTALDVLTRVRLKGFGLSIDDFGIGYSSFEQLDRIPFTELKLDRSFVSKGVKDATARAILQSSMDMAQKMGLSTVAEGVESEADLDLIRALGCERAQGYFIARPMPIEELFVWLRRDAEGKAGA